MTNMESYLPGLIQNFSEESVITQILQKFELPELIQRFRRERIDQECLKFMTESDLEKLIPQLHLRIKFRAKLSAWRRFKTEQRNILDLPLRTSPQFNEVKDQSTIQNSQYVSGPTQSESLSKSSLSFLSPAGSSLKTLWQSSPRNEVKSQSTIENTQYVIGQTQCKSLSTPKSSSSIPKEGWLKQPANHTNDIKRDENAHKKSRWEPLNSVCNRYDVTEGNTTDRSQQMKCFGCQKVGHLVKNCTFAVCYFCKETGHIARDCTQRLVNFNAGRQNYSSSGDGGSENRGKQELQREDSSVRHQKFGEYYSIGSSLNLKTNHDQRRLSTLSDGMNLQGPSDANVISDKAKKYDTQVVPVVKKIDRPTITHGMRLNASNFQQYVNIKDCSVQQPRENVTMDVPKAQKRNYIDTRYNDAPKNKLIKDDTSGRPMLKESGNEKERTGDNTICFRCGKAGHTTRYCPQPKIIKCYGCQDIGHEIKDCPKRQILLKCYSCEKIGHIARNCFGFQNKLDHYRGTQRRNANNSDELFENRVALGGSDGSSERRCLRYISPVNIKLANAKADVSSAVVQKDSLTSGDNNKTQQNLMSKAEDSLEVIQEDGYKRPPDQCHFNNISTSDDFIGCAFDLDAYLNYG